VCSAPKGVLTSELRAELVRHKSEVLQFLRCAVPQASLLPDIQRILDRTELPVSAGQQRLWFLDQFQPHSCAYNIFFALELSGELHSAALEASLREIVSRHEVLRCRVANLDGVPKALPYTGCVWELHRTDLRHVETSKRDDWATQFAKQEAQQPFDLAGGPLFRARLLEFSDQYHVLLLSLHHIAADGWSLGILVQELAELYTAFREDRPSPLPTPVLQYADFAQWQAQQLQSEPIRDQLRYWRKQLQPSLPVVELPADRPRPPLPSFRGARRRFTLPKELADSVRELAVEEEATPFIVLLSAFYLLLNRYTHQEDLVVGSAVAGRSRPEWESLIGLFINNLALRTSLAGDPTVRQLIARVRDTSLNAFANQDIPFDQLVAALHLDRSINRSPAFDVMFILQNFPVRPFNLPGLSIRPLHIDAGTARFDLTIEASEDEGGSMQLYFEYSTDLFDDSTIEQLARHYIRLLKGIVAGPLRIISEIPMFGPEELRDLQLANERTRVWYPRDACIHELFETQAARTPDRIAVICGSDEITYAELNRRSSSLASQLRGLGVGPDVLVGICLQRSIDMVTAVLGVLKAGGAYVPMDPHFPRERLAFMARDASVRVLLTDEASRVRVPVTDATVLSLNGNRADMDGHSDSCPTAKAAADNLAYVIYTSGSTGSPKGVQITHRSVVNFLESMRRQPGLNEDDCLLAVTTLSFDIAALEIYLPLIAGARVVLASRSTASDGRALARLIDDANVTIMQATPATWRMLLDAGWVGKSDLRILCGGEAMPRELANRLLPNCAVLWNLYGPTETTIWSTLYRVAEGEDPVPIGTPIANTTVYVLDDHGQPVPSGVSGELHIGGDGLARGYLNRPELTGEKFVPHPFASGERLYRTGDLARFLADGTLQFLGRLDHQVKIRGFRVELGEIENALKHCPGLSDAVVTLREDVPGDRRLVAYVIPRTAVELSPDTLRTELLKTLPDFMVPSAFVVQQSFPLTPNRKMDRRALPRPELRSLPVTPCTLPKSETEKCIAGIWKDLLHCERVGIHDNFFDLGGHSLLLVQLQSRLRHRFGQEIPMLELFQKPTIALMAELLAAVAVDNSRFHGEYDPVRGETTHA